jgi:hypothetical protein
VEGRQTLAAQTRFSETAVESAARAAASRLTSFRRMAHVMRGMVMSLRTHTANDQTANIEQRRASGDGRYAREGDPAEQDAACPGDVVADSKDDGAKCAGHVEEREAIADAIDVVAGQLDRDRGLGDAAASGHAEGRGQPG